MRVLTLVSVVAAIGAGVLWARTARAQDFNGDGFDDLAIGVEGEDVVVGAGEVSGAGAVNVIYGSASGLDSAGDQFWSQASLGILDASEHSDFFGATLGHGDFDGDGFDDLAVGVPFENLLSGGGITDEDDGAVNVIYGSAVGLSAAGNQLWTQDSPGLAGDLERDWFGIAVASGDFNADGFDDLAIGADGFDDAIGAGSVASGVHVIYGSAGGLTSTGSQLWTPQDASCEPSACGNYGRTLANGDFNGDGFDDLAIGDPNLDGLYSRVEVLHGSPSGLTASGFQIWSQGSPGIQDSPEFGDLFGQALAAGNLNGDGFDDLAIGAPWEDVTQRNGTVADAGVVHVLYGSAGGLTAAGAQLWSQGSPGDGVADAIEEGDLFGSALAIGNFSGLRGGALATGVPFEDFFQGIDHIDRVGAVHVLYGCASGLSTTNSQFWHQTSPGIEDSIEDGDQFGKALGAANFDGDGRKDLAVGVPQETLSFPYAGAVNVIYGTASGLGSAGDQLWSQDSPGIANSEEYSDRFGSGLTR